MNIFSRWILTDGKNRDLVSDFAATLGERDVESGDKRRRDDWLRL
jgi:hypothetical protein